MVWHILIAISSCHLSLFIDRNSLAVRHVIGLAAWQPAKNVMEASTYAPALLLTR